MQGQDLDSASPSSALTAHAYFEGLSLAPFPFSTSRSGFSCSSLLTRWLGLRSDSPTDWLRAVERASGDVISGDVAAGRVSAPRRRGRGREGRDRGRRRQLAEEGGIPGPLRAGERGVTPRDCLRAQVGGKREPGGLGSRVPFAGLTCFRLELPAGPRMSALKMEEDLRGPLREFGSLETRSLFHSPPHSTNATGLVIHQCWHDHFIFDFFTVPFSPALSTSAWILQQSPSGLSACLYLPPKPFCTHIQIYLPETFHL